MSSPMENRLRSASASLNLVSARLAVGSYEASRSSNKELSSQLSDAVAMVDAALDLVDQVRHGKAVSEATAPGNEELTRSR